MRYRKITPELLEQTARAYRRGKPTPTMAVQRAFGCSYRTAGRYVALAREAGYLGAADWDDTDPADHCLTILRSLDGLPSSDDED